MKQFSQLVIILAILGFVTCQESCKDHAREKCSDGTDVWTEGSSWGSCNAVYGNITGNKNYLRTHMANNLKQSFQFIAMSSYLKSDIVNRMGLSNIMLEHSNKMWERAQKIIHFMLDRGSKTSDMYEQFTLSNVNPRDIYGEIKALAHTLTTLKNNTEEIFRIHKHANNKHVHQGKPAQDAYDPSVMQFLEDELIGDYQKDIRQVSGQLNVLGKMAKHHNSRNMGLHL